LQASDSNTIITSTFSTTSELAHTHTRVSRSSSNKYDITGDIAATNVSAIANTYASALNASAVTNLFTAFGTDM
jgi:hypothetical protein